MKKFLKQNKLYIILCLLILVCFFSSAYYYFFIAQNKTVESNITQSEDKVIKIDSSETPSDYLGETVADSTGDYPLLYSYPFKKTDLYVCNKDFYKNKQEYVEPLCSRTSQFFHTLLGTGYRTVINNPETWNNTMLKYFDEDMITNNGTKEYNAKERLEEISDYLVTNRVSIDSEFITDKSLVYSDGYIYVRGNLKFKIISSDDNNCQYKTGEEYNQIIDIALKQSTNSSGISDYVIADINLLD